MAQPCSVGATAQAADHDSPNPSKCFRISAQDIAPGVLLRDVTNGEVYESECCVGESVKVYKVSNRRKPDTKPKLQTILLSDCILERLVEVHGGKIAEGDRVTVLYGKHHGERGTVTGFKNENTKATVCLDARGGTSENTQTRSIALQPEALASESVTVTVFGSSQTQPGSEDWLRAEHVGRLLASNGAVLRNGGYCGTMEASAKGCKEAGGVSEGVIVPNIFVSRDRRGNQYLTRAIESSSLIGRLDDLTRNCRIFVALPGTLGTLAELVVVWNEASLAPLYHAAMPRVFAWRDPWQSVLEHSGKALAICQAHMDMVEYVDDVRHLARLLGLSYVP
eukprot:comp18960_c0_seq1/m.21227 comp18960_c0_seq1/g.21227  ORF comp18960_c0_seq1/g.21227 comp18960_c0_seq1/m.21227 type:complete len:337 (-) comp18960_c0_seq1:294-1304(-)